ncbi:MAG: ParA family protein [Candidatus Omnitrophica bacterium]|nr:ParA family protein [Candidatus Omnitrophota bacterium]
MSRAIAICNQKGGVGKSTTAVNVGSCLAISGRRTLLIDLDPQGNATTACGIQRKNLEQDTYDVLVNNLPFQQAIRKTQIDLLDIIPASLNLAGAEPFLAQMDKRERELVLRTSCESAKNGYEFLLFDCPPSLGLLTVNALVAADSTIIPVQCEYLALEGLNTLLHAIDLVRQELNPSLRIGGIVLTMTDFRATLAREVAEEVKRFFRDLVFTTSIPRNIKLAEAPSFGKPICLYDPNSTGALAYHLLTQEVINKEIMEQR